MAKPVAPPQDRKASHSSFTRKAPPSTADPYSSNKPAPIGSAAGRTTANFYGGGGQVRGPGGNSGASQNSLFGGDSKAEPVTKVNKNFANVVADDDEDDDWDKVESP